MPLSILTDSERKDIARRYLDGAEHWLRRIVHHQLSKELGANYLSRGPWRKAVVDRVAKGLAKSSKNSFREVDFTFFDDLIYIICCPERWDSRFAQAFQLAFPPGAETTKFFLARLKSIRNDVSHGRGCTTHELEQAICYANDIAFSLKAFFRKENMDREFNVPMIVKYVDSVGNESSLEGVSTDINTRIIDWRRGLNGDLHPGDTLVAEVEIDPSFAVDEYQVRWDVFGAMCGGVGRVARVSIGNTHVGEQFELSFQVVTNKDWHRKHGLDDRLTLLFRVLPPT